MAQRIVFVDRGKVTLEHFECGPVADSRSLRFRTSYSLISSGTEGIALRGLFDQDTHWSRWVSYPFKPGYSAVGVVEEVGPDVTDFTVGDHVAARVGHASEHVVPAALCTRLPDGVPPERACWFGLAKIGLIGAQAAKYQLGDATAVIGAGPIGQVSVRWAAAAGVTTLIVVDPIRDRLELARRGGATHVVAAGIHDAYADVLAACEGGRPRVIVDTTGNAAVFAEALRLVADHGRLTLLGDTGSPTKQHLTSDVIVRGVTITGAHDAHSVSRHGQEGERRLHRIFFQLVRDGRFDVAGLTTHVFSPADCESAYQTAVSEADGALGVAFDWSRL